MKHLLLSLVAFSLLGADPSVLKFCLRSEPKTFHPLMAGDDASETVPLPHRGHPAQDQPANPVA